LTVSPADAANWRAGWTEMLALGVPRSLSFIGIALGTGAVILSLRRFGAGNSDASIAAYGVAIRLLTFAYFPLLGMGLALQAMVANNFGAGLWARSNATLMLALVSSLVYAGLVEAGLLLARHQLGWLFVSDPLVIAQVGGILPFIVALYVTTGPMMMIASYFQSIGDVRRSALLSLSRTYLFAIPLTLLLPLLLGETGIWTAMPMADALLLVVTGLVLQARSWEMEWGLFRQA
jgi:Na+-driven multidrug efflux pump